jgi:uncharacterized membrane protein YhaH (DUF805 family)
MENRMKILGLNLKRLNRSSYILTILVSMFVFVAVGLVFSGFFNALLGPMDPSMPESPHPLGLLPFMTLWFVYFALCSAKRFHDITMSGWLSLFVFVPFAGFIVGILLIFMAGTSDSNKYGEPLRGLSVMGIGSGER